MGKNGWTGFTKRIPIKAHKTDIFQSLATQEGIEKWFLRLAEFTRENGEIRNQDEFVQSGDSYSWFWFGWSDDVNQKGRILETNGKDFIKFTFHDPMEVSVRILEEDGEKVVELTQENIPPDEDSKTNFFVGCGEGWTFYLANLKSVLEGGIDLRNKNENIQKVINS